VIGELVLRDHAVVVPVGALQTRPDARRDFLLGELAVTVFIEATECMGRIAGRRSRALWAATLAAGAVAALASTAWRAHQRKALQLFLAQIVVSPLLLRIEQASDFVGDLLSVLPKLATAILGQAAHELVAFFSVRRHDFGNLGALLVGQIELARQGLEVPALEPVIHLSAQLVGDLSLKPGPGATRAGHGAESEHTGQDQHAFEFRVHCQSTSMVP
jgi:hypothetical protein